MVINGAGDILWRKGRPQEPGTFDPPIKINPGHPSRDIVAVNTNQGRVLASVEPPIKRSRCTPGATAASSGSGRSPPVRSREDRHGRPQRRRLGRLVVRNAGDGTLTVFFTNGSGSAATGNALFPSSVTLPVGLGVSDVTLADVDQDGVPDIIVTNKISGEVGVLRNWPRGLRPGRAVPCWRRPVRRDEQHRRLGDPHDPGGDLGRGRRHIHPGRPSRPGRADPGSNTFSLLAGLAGPEESNARNSGRLVSLGLISLPSHWSCPMCGRRPRPLEIAPHDVPILQQIARSRSLPWYQVQRSKVLLGRRRGGADPNTGHPHPMQSVDCLEDLPSL